MPAGATPGEDISDPSPVHEGLHFRAPSAQKSVRDELQRADIHIDGPAAHEAAKWT
jgi:hypothetical protein